MLWSRIELSPKLSELVVLSLSILSHLLHFSASIWRFTFNPRISLSKESRCHTFDHSLQFVVWLLTQYLTVVCSVEFYKHTVVCDNHSTNTNKPNGMWYDSTINSWTTVDSNTDNVVVWWSSGVTCTTNISPLSVAPCCGIYIVGKSNFLTRLYPYLALLQCMSARRVLVCTFCSQLVILNSLTLQAVTRKRV